jgi:hypothetical protein
MSINVFGVVVSTSIWIIHIVENVPWKLLLGIVGHHVIKA